jgi:hypothetical protein
MTGYYTARTFAAPAGNLMTIEEVMVRVGCAAANRDEFVRTARRSGLPRVRLNRRTIRYDPLAVEAWIRSRSA